MQALRPQACRGVPGSYEVSQVAVTHRLGLKREGSLASIASGQPPGKKPKGLVVKFGKSHT